MKKLKRLSEGIDKNLFRGENRINLVGLEKILEKTYESLIEISKEPEYFRNVRYMLYRVKQLNHFIKKVHKAQKRKKLNKRFKKLKEKNRRYN